MCLYKRRHQRIKYTWLKEKNHCQCRPHHASSTYEKKSFLCSASGIEPDGLRNHGSIAIHSKRTLAPAPQPNEVRVLFLRPFGLNLYSNND